MIIGAYRTTRKQARDERRGEQFRDFHITQTPWRRLRLIPKLLSARCEITQSPGAGEGAAGNMPDAGSFPAPDHFSTI
jgi:hypothetical protein